MELLKIFLGVFIVGFTLRALNISMSTFKWPKTTGVVGVGPIDEFRGYIRVKGSKLVYGYNIDGKEYYSNRVVAAIPDNLFTYQIFFNSDTFVSANYKHGQTIDVFFNPNDPSQSCLIKGGSKYVLIEAAIWFVFYLLFLALWQ